MEVKWIVDKHIFKNNKIPRKEFEKLETDLFEFEYIPFMQGGPEDIPFSPTEPVVVYGTVNAVRNLRSFYGCYFNEFNFKTNVYMSLFGDSSMYLNDDHVYSTFSNIISDPIYYYDLFQKDSLFFRPLDGIKSFTGDVIPKRSIDTDINVMNNLYNLAPESMILISTPKKIYEESRFLIGNNEIIDYSRYMVDDNMVQDKNTDTSAIMFAKDIINHTTWTPDDLYTMDIAMTDNGPKIIELNSFSCAGWYGMDVHQVIKNVNSIVLENFKKESQLL